MDLRSGYAFWPIRDGLLHSYPGLNGDLTADIVVIGGGISGALVAYTLVQAGLDVTVIERRDIAAGSTSASTALIQYEIDTPLVDLTEMIGRANAERSYQLCREAIDKIEALANKVAPNCDFSRKKSLQIASRRRDMKALEREYQARRAMGLELALLSREDIAARFSFDAPGGLLSATAAQLDPYALTHALLKAASDAGARVFDRTTITHYQPTERGVEMNTDRGGQVFARKVVFATGYESQQYLKQRVVDFDSSYAFISEPLAAFPGWGEDQCLIWETAMPYIYMRTTVDGRILMGGEDDPFDDENRRDRRLAKKTARLVKRFRAMFPDIPLEVAYSWAGTFGETRDGLPYIGQTNEFPNAFFTLGYGGNGINYSLIGAELIRDALTGRPNPDAALFAFDRKK